MDERHVVTCFLRNDGEILLLCRSEEVGSYQGQWGGVAGHVADDDGNDRDPETAARAEIAEETGLEDAVTLVRSGDPFPVEDEERGTRWIVHPFLFESSSRTVTTNEETLTTEWVHPPEILDRETVPRLWTSYDRVRPRVESVRDDRTHGSAWLSMRALEVLRDESALAAAQRWDELETTERSSDDWDGIARLAETVLAARPSMAVVANRVNRVLFAAQDDHMVEAIETAATGAIMQATSADDTAAEQAADRLRDRVATLSRSGTVEQAIRAADPSAVLLAESRPGREGVGVAESLAAEFDVTLSTDAAFAFELDDWDAETLVVGADRILPDGSVVNKAGTRSAALAAAHDGIDCLVVAATDKVATTADYDLEPRDAEEVYDGAADVTVANPTFDVTPADAVTAVVTEQGVLDAEEIASVAAAHREWESWREDS